MRLLQSRDESGLPPSSPSLYDQQTDPVGDRTLFKPAYRIIRPFKCNPALTNNVLPATNMVAAPFVNETQSRIRNVNLKKPYLEFVARIRFSKDIKSTSGSNDLINNLTSNIEELLENTPSLLSNFDQTKKGIAIKKTSIQRNPCTVILIM